MSDGGGMSSVRPVLDRILDHVDPIKSENPAQNRNHLSRMMPEQMPDRFVNLNFGGGCIIYECPDYSG